MLSYRSRTQYHHMLKTNMPGYFHRSVISLQLQYYCIKEEKQKREEGEIKAKMLGGERYQGHPKSIFGKYTFGRRFKI